MSIKVIGMGEEGRPLLPELYQTWIAESDRLVGGERLLSYFPEYEGERLFIEEGLVKVVKQLQQVEGNTIVLASGDPLFYGIGGYLAKKLENIDIYPSTSSLQLAFSRIGESWQDAKMVSVHGRSMKGLAQRINGEQKVCLLTDGTNTPAAIADYLLSFGMDEYELFIGERLGGSEEKTGWFTLDKAAQYEADPLNVVILKAQRKGKEATFGIPDNNFIQRKPDKGLITKKEVRVLSLSALSIANDDTVWDIGTCTGSVAIEAAKLAKNGQVYAIEKNEEDLGFACENAQNMRTDIHFAHGKAPEGLEDWPDPDAVFLGGTGGNLEKLLQVCCERLKADGRIVLNAATIENLYEAKTCFENLDFQTEITMTQIARSKPILHMTRFEGLNPVYIISAWKKEENA